MVTSAWNDEYISGQGSCWLKSFQSCRSEKHCSNYRGYRSEGHLIFRVQAFEFLPLATSQEQTPANGKKGQLKAGLWWSQEKCWELFPASQVAYSCEYQFFLLKAIPLIQEASRWECYFCKPVRETIRIPSRYEDWKPILSTPNPELLRPSPNQA